MILLLQLMGHRQYAELSLPIIVADGQSVLQYFGLAQVNKFSYVGYDALFFVAFGVLAYLALSYIRHDKR